MNVHPSRLLTACPLCHTAYKKDGVKFVGHEGASQMFHCHCVSCGHAMLAIILEQGSWVGSVGVLTDLEAADAIRFQSAKPIAAEDCVTWHQALDKGSTELCRQLSEKMTQKDHSERAKRRGIPE